MEGDGYNKETGQKLFYDTLVEKDRNFPLDAVSFMQFNGRFAPKVVSDWSGGKFARCKWQVIDYKAHDVYDNLHFANVTEYADWKTLNIAHTGSAFDGYVDLRAYDIVDETIPVFSRVWGYNTMYMSMKGGKRYKSGPRTMFYGKSFQQLMVDMWDIAFPSLAGSFTTTDFNPGDKHRNLFWTSSHYKNIYSMPKVSGQEMIRGPYQTATDGRHVYSSSGGLVQVPNDWFVIDKVYFATETSFNNHTLHMGSTHSVTKKIRNDILGAYQGRGIAFYSLYGKNDSSNKAILVKPVGIDIVWLNYFDSNKYDLEVVYFDTDTQQIDFDVIDSSEFWRSNPTNGIGIFKSTFLKGIASPGLRYRSANFDKMPDIYFRLRDKTTHNVGRLSRAKINIQFGKDIYPCNFMVRNGTKGV